MNHKTTAAQPFSNQPLLSKVELSDLVAIGGLIAMVYGTGLIVFKVGSYFNQQKETLSNLTTELQNLSKTINHIDSSITSLEDWAITKGYKRVK